jgi:hypothetical protein
LVSFLAIPVGAVTALSGGTGMLIFPAVTPDERAAQQQRERDELRQAQQAQAAKAREQAWQLTKQAAEVARTGDCQTVTQRDNEIRELDSEFHATVFMRDAAIKRCIDSAATAKPQAAPAR